MTRFLQIIPIVVVAGLAGCHLTGAGEGGMPADLEAGRGRVEKTYTASLGQSVRATLDALDELDVKPLDGTIRANESASQLGKAKWVGQTNAEYLPDDSSFHDLFERQRLSVAGSDPIPFAPILMAYKGEIKPGQAVIVIVRSVPPDARQTQVMTRVGRDGDEAWSRQFLDKVSAHLPQPAATVVGAAASPGTTPPALADLPPLP